MTLVLHGKHISLDGRFLAVIVTPNPYMQKAPIFFIYGRYSKILNASCPPKRQSLTAQTASEKAPNCFAILTSIL